MNRFERDLREALKHGEPPAYFADKVIARARGREKHSVSWRWLAAAAALVLMIGAGFVVQEQRREAKNEQAKEQLMVALRITGSKVRRVQERLSSIQQHTIQLQLEQ
jgi:hypothetical protein